MPMELALSAVNARQILPAHDMKDVAANGIPHVDCVVRLDKLGPPPHQLPTMLRNTELLNERARTYHVRRRRNVSDIYFLNLLGARIDGISIVHKSDMLFPEGFRASMCQNILVGGTATVGGEPMTYAGTPHSYRITCPDGPPTELKGTSLLLKSSHSNYWAFWQMDTAAKVFFWLSMGKPKDWQFLVDEGTPAYQIEIYCKLGVPAEKILRLQSGESYVAERLIVGSPMIIWNGGFSAEFVSVWDNICEAIAHEACVDLKALAEERRERILFISREDVARHRPTSNIEQVNALLRARGADFVVPGTLSLTEKLRAFYGYGCISGALGSGVNNLVFGGKGGAFLGLWPWYLEDRYIFDVCDCQNRTAYLLFSDGFVTAKQSDRMRYKSPFVVDTKMMSDILDEITSELAAE